MGELDSRGFHSGAKAVSSGLGQPVRRAEDLSLITGRGCFVDDVTPAGVVWASIVRSPHAHAKILHIDIEQARGAPGVLAVLTGDDYAADGLGNIPCISIPDAVMGGGWFRTPFPALTRERVLCVGDPVAVVIAESGNQARDAAEQVMVDYEPLPACSSLSAALEDGSPAVWPERPDNLCFVHELGDKAQTDAAFAAAKHIVRRRIVNQRIAGNPLEPRACIGRFDPRNARYRLVTATQTPHRIQRLLAESVFRVPAHCVQVQAGDVGGGFGTKGNLYPEEVLVLWAARRTGRAVKWLSDRSESFLSDFHGRDQIADAEMALDGNGRILGLRVTTHTNLGCRVGPSGAHPPLIGARLLSGAYAIPAMHVTIRGVLTHTGTTTTYRGAGRPEAAFVVERMMDIAARELGIDRVELRKRNLIAKEQMPYRTAVGETYDSGDFPGLMERTLVLGDWDGFGARRDSSATKGLLRGRGLSLFVEVSSVLHERMEIRFDATGCATIVAGTFPQGQGHGTVYRQMLVEWLGLPFEEIRVMCGDTDLVAYGGGTFASRSMTVGGSALKAAAEGIVEKGRKLAAIVLEAAADEIEFRAGTFHISGTGRKVELPELARIAHATARSSLPPELATGLSAVGHYSVDRESYPNGCQIVEVEIDPETGEVRIVRYTAVNDVGRVLNPLLYEGQVRGGIAQGAGQALMEAVVYGDDGQLLSGSFTDYALPRAADLPEVRLETRNIPTANNPLGVKGAGEIGTVGAAAAVINAVLDALAPCGVDDISMPAGSLKVWEEIHAAASRAVEQNMSA